MCLELLNSLIGLPFAWLGLTLMAAVVAGLAALYLLHSRKKAAKNRPSSSFTCPCYSPPVIHTEKEQ
jgi:hypothetical protein